MAAYTSMYETRVQQAEAWQRISATQLRKKIVKTWFRVYVGIRGEEAADTLLANEIGLYSNVTEGEAHHVAGGMWEVNLSFKTAEWANPAQYMNG